MAELKIDDKTKSVGDTSITITGTSHEATVNDVTDQDGLVEPPFVAVADHVAILIRPWTDGQGIPGTWLSPPMILRAITEPTPGAQTRTFDIGVVYDSDDDSARLALVTKYGAGTKTCNGVRGQH